MSSASKQAAWTRQTAGVRLLTEVQGIRVLGDDARSWLNGQCTNDVRQVGSEAPVYALVVSLKGRILADAWVRADSDEDITMVTPRSAVPKLLEYLDQFIIMEDVELSAREDFQVLTVQGAKAAEVVDAAEVRTLARYECDRLGAGGIDLWVDPADAEGALDALSAAAEQQGGGRLDDEGWRAAHVAQGVPAFGREFGEDTYPQEAGLKARAVSFDKGCYQGQEVVCMLENRGQLKRRLVQLGGEKPVNAGDELKDAEGKRVGKVTTGFVTEGGEPATLALGFVSRAHAQVGKEVSAGGQSLAVLQVVGEVGE